MDSQFKNGERLLRQCTSYSLPDRYHELCALVVCKDKTLILLLAFCLLLSASSATKKTETATKPPAPPPPPPEILFIQFSPLVTARPPNDDVTTRPEEYLRKRVVYEIEPYLGTQQNQNQYQNNLNQLTLNNPDFNVFASRPISNQKPPGHQGQTQGQRPNYQQPQRPQYQGQVQRPQYQQPQGQRPQYQGQTQRPQYQGQQRPQYQQPQRPQYQKPQPQRPQAQRPVYNPPRLPFASVIASPLAHHSRPREDVRVVSS
ncbi:hypothetical protein LSTR_LSTR012617 [Laodelphax striatellus]|uniref:Uncharacterized protein n=1 Tax=Laodelphax striatellus TaxID=195883 RepID=A0A482XNE0_LAOST|nr:hypothetical protein LSTR_LSTR012617 [Laodelphax striatellus]